MTDPIRELAARCNDVAIATFRRRMGVTGTDPAAAGGGWRPEDDAVAAVLRDAGVTIRDSRTENERIAELERELDEARQDRDAADTAAGRMGRELEKVTAERDALRNELQEALKNPQLGPLAILELRREGWTKLDDETIERVRDTITERWSSDRKQRGTRYHVVAALRDLRDGKLEG